MSDAAQSGSSGPATAPDGRPLGPDGRPLPGPAQIQQVRAQRKMTQQQKEVDEVIGIMKNNVEKVLERDAKLSELDERADALQDGASQFEKQAGKLKNKFWLQNMKFIIIGGIIGLILLILLYMNFTEDEPSPKRVSLFSDSPGPEDMRKIQAQRKMNQQQAQVDEVIGIMHKNVEAVLERDSKLTALEERADALQDGSAQFEKRAASLKNKFWLENLKSMIAMGVVGFIVLGLIYWNFFHESAPPYPYPYPPPQAPAGPAPPQQQGGEDAAAGGDAGDAGSSGE